MTQKFTEIVQIVTLKNRNQKDEHKKDNYQITMKKLQIGIRSSVNISGGFDGT